MHKKIIKLSGLVFISVLINSCKTDFDEIRFTSGTADFSHYIALGNSLTAGYQDNALCADGQANAYPSILHQQFKKAGGASDFLIPFLTGDDATLGVTPSPDWPNNPFKTSTRLALGYKTTCEGLSELMPVLIGPDNLNNSNFYTTLLGSPSNHFCNLGVPGARSFNLTEQTFGMVLLGGNPYYQRFASNPGVSTVVEDAKAANPTFFTLWIGNNDVLGYATSGGDGSTSGMGGSDITPVDTFQNAINRIVDDLTSNGALGAVGNIPDVTSIPFFTTIPYNGLELSSQQEIDSLNNSYAVYNASATAMGLAKIEFETGKNAYVIEDNNPPYNALGGIRQILSGELICINVPQDSLKCAK